MKKKARNNTRTLARLALEVDEDIIHVERMATHLILSSEKGASA